MVCVIKTFLLLAIILIDFHGFIIVNSVNEGLINFLLDCNICHKSAETSLSLY